MQRNRDESEGRRIGELATATGLTIRALHYYEEIGLVVASSRTDAGHRVYGRADIERLYRVTLLSRLGLSLAVIRQALDDPDWSLTPAVASHLRRLEERLEAEHRCRRIPRAGLRLRSRSNNNRRFRSNGPR